MIEKNILIFQILRRAFVGALHKAFMISTMEWKKRRKSTALVRRTSVDWPRVFLPGTPHALS